MNPPLIKYHVLLFINGSHVGDNATFADWYANDAAAISDARSFFTAEGYAIESVLAEEREIKPASHFSPARFGKALVVRLIKT